MFLASNTPLRVRLCGYVAMRVDGAMQCCRLIARQSRVWCGLVLVPQCGVFMFGGVQFA